MFGPLVFVYPGGELVLHHKDRKGKFDTKSLTFSQSPPSFAYVAFYGDIKHNDFKLWPGGTEDSMPSIVGSRIGVTSWLQYVPSPTSFGLFTGWLYRQHPIPPEPP